MMRGGNAHASTAMQRRPAIGPLLLINLGSQFLYQIANTFNLGTITTNAHAIVQLGALNGREASRTMRGQKMYALYSPNCYVYLGII